MKSMKFIQIQAMFLLIDLAERIFLDADGVFRGLPPEGWYLPEWIGEIRSSVFLCLVIALYAGDYLICRTGGGPSGENGLRKHGILWALFFYLPYLLYGCALDIGFLLLGAGRLAGAVFFLLKMACAVWMGVRLYRMPGAHRRESGHREPEKQNRLFAFCVLVFFAAAWFPSLWPDIGNPQLRIFIAIVWLLTLGYILIWPIYHHRTR